MKIKQRFTLSNVIMLLAPILMIGAVSVVFLIVFVMRYPVEQLHITRASLLNPEMLMQVIGDFFKSNPDALSYVLMWFFLCIIIMTATTTFITWRLSRSIEKPITRLKNAADNIRNGNLDFEVMGSELNEIDALCSGFDDMRRELKRASEKEEYMKKERNMLLANISHDLKTPVTSIKGYIEGIRDGIADTPEKQEKYLDTIYSKAIAIDNLVNNLSLYSKLELSALPFHFSITDINAFARDIIDDYRLDLEKNGIQLSIQIPHEPFLVKLDCEKMGRVFSNIISNAIKYKRPDNAHLHIAMHTEDNGIYITFTDDGIGISAEDLANVFKGFYRVDSARSKTVDGSGLGLGIAKQITENHGGKMWLKSNGIGSGTSAVIYLPERI